MTRILSTAVILRSPAEVFVYVTTPGHWPEWHPSSLDVAGTTDHPLAVGEQVTERYRVAGSEGTVVWTVTVREEPVRWAISGEIVGQGFGGTVSYGLTADDGGTRFTRVFEYPTPEPAELAEMVGRQIQAESDAAVRRLKARLESDS